MVLKSAVLTSCALRKAVSAIARPVRFLARGLVVLIDVIQRKLLGIVEFSSDPDCLARIALSVSRAETRLPDGTLVRKGEPVVEIHLWNEKVPQIPPAGPDAAWAMAFRRKVIKSLRELASYVEREPSMAGVRVFHGGTSFARRAGLTRDLTAGDLASRLGFFVVRPAVSGAGGTAGFADGARAPHGIGRLFIRFRDFWENLYYLALVWAFNPQSLATKSLGRLERVDLYMTRQTLLDRYGSVEGSRSEAGR